MIIVANLKMNLNYDEVKDYISKIKKLTSLNNFIVCPSNIYALLFLNEGFNVCVQNISRYESGAHTGEVSAKQVSSMNIEYTLLGHAEKRFFCEETNNVVNMKIKNALNNNIKVILCIGETKEEREKNNIKEPLEKELTECLEGISVINNIIIAYEPICSVDSGFVLSNEKIEESIDYIKNFIKNKYNKDIDVLYGGSVNDDNINDLKVIKNVSGFLVGSASLDVNKLLKIKEIVG